MNTEELAWHKEQAAKITGAEGTVAFTWWEVGQRLNSIYGYAERPQRDDPEAIPASEMAQISEIYGVEKSTIYRSRTFNFRCPDRDEAAQVVSEYGSWSSILQGYLRDIPAAEVRETRRQRAADYYQHARAIPSHLLKDLAREGLSAPDAREAVRLFLENATAREVVLIWQARKNLRIAG